MKPENKTLLVRALSGLTAFPLAVSLVYAGGWWFVALAVFAAGACLLEWMGMTLPDDRFARVLMIGVGLSFLFGLLSGDLLSVRGLVVSELTLMGCLLYFLFRPGDLATAASRIGLAGLGVIWICGLFAALGHLRQLPEGETWMLQAFVVAFGSDTGGYFSGKYFGKKKLYERISPKKTWAGALGGVAFAIVCAVSCRLIVGGPSGPPVWHLALVAAVAAPLGQTGDLAQSLIKRSVGVKDSGTIMPGHGGLFDRVDALLFVAPPILAYAVFFQRLDPSWFSVSW